jgi:hypothetical protein
MNKADYVGKREYLNDLIFVLQGEFDKYSTVIGVGYATHCRLADTLRHARQDLAGLSERYAQMD